MQDPNLQKLLDGLLYPVGVARPGEVDPALIKVMVRKLLDASIAGGLSTEDSVTLVAQLLVWSKLSEEGVWPKESRIHEIRLTYDEIERVGRELDQIGSLPYFQVFERFSERLRYIGFASLIRMLEEIRQCVVKGRIDYLVAVDAITETITFQTTVMSLPSELAELGIELLGMESTASLYCPFDSSWRFAMEAAKTRDQIFAEMSSRGVFPLALSALSGGAVQVRFSDPISEPSWIDEGFLKIFDYSAVAWLGGKIAKEPMEDFFRRFPEKASYGEVYAIRHALAQTKKRVVAIVPNGLLFKTTAGERQFKASLVDQGWLMSVIELPGGLLPGTNMAISILIFDKQRSERGVLFVDGTGSNFVEQRIRRAPNVSRLMLRNADQLVHMVRHPQTTSISQLVAADSCERNDFNLLVERYLVAEELTPPSSRQFKQLDDVVSQLIRCQSVRSDGEAVAEFWEIAVSDIQSDGYIREASKKVSVSKRLLGQAQQMIVKPGDILIAIKGSVGTVGLIPEDAGEDWIAGQSFMILRPNREQIDPIVLFRFLQSPNAQTYFQTRASGNTVKMIPSRDLREFPVLVFTKEEQRRIREIDTHIASLLANVSRLQGLLEELQDSFWQQFETGKDIQNQGRDE